MKWLAEKPSFVRYHLCVTTRKHRAWVCRATSAMRFWAISCWASAQNGSTSEVRHLVCTGNFFFIDHCSMFNAVPVSDLLPPSCALCKKTPNKHTHTPRTVSRRWKQLGATRPGPLNSQGQRLAHPVLSWHIGLTFVVLHNWLGYATRLALKKNVYVLNISYLVSLSNLLFAVFFLFFFFVQIKSCGTFIIFPARLGAKFDELWDNLFENTVCGPGQVKHYGSYVIWHLQGPLSSHATAGAKYLSSTCKNIVIQ